jgi:hypothetical protein
VTLGAGNNIVNGGQNSDLITLTGGSATLNLGGNYETAVLGGGVSATVNDHGSHLRVLIGSSSGTDVINGLAQDQYGYIELINNAGGYSSVSEVLGALHSDGHGGSLLALGPSGSLDISGIAPNAMSANHFKIG